NFVKKSRESVEKAVNKDFLKKLKKVSQNPHISQVLDKASRLWKIYKTDDLKQLSKEEKTYILFALFYFVFPWDALVDTIPIMGYLDDAYVISTVFNLISKKINISKTTEEVPDGKIQTDACGEDP